MPRDRERDTPIFKKTTSKYEDTLERRGDQTKLLADDIRKIKEEAAQRHGEYGRETVDGPTHGDGETRSEAAHTLDAGHSQGRGLGAGGGGQDVGKSVCAQE